MGYDKGGVWRREEGWRVGGVEKGGEEWSEWEVGRPGNG